jgi:Lrp/AsnC family leucine-responsive transcriptional regulator
MTWVSPTVSGVIAGHQFRPEIEQGAGVFITHNLDLCSFSYHYQVFVQDFHQMDNYDTRILSALQKEGRISWLQLASRINLSASACQRRVESLVEKGIIENFTVNLNEAELGHQVKAFVAVSMDRQSPALAEEFRRQVREHPQVQACHMLSGNIDFMLEVVASDLDSFGQFIDGDLLSMPAVKDASSSIVLKVVKKKRIMIT